MSSVNKATLIGNLGDDPEIARLQSGREVANFSVATTQKWRDAVNGEKRERTEWHRVVVYNEGLVKVCESYLKKGSKIYIEGAIQTRKYEKNGEDRFITEIVLQAHGSTLVLLGDPKDRDDDRSSRETRGRTKQEPVRNQHQKTDYDDDIPF
jgi:single-strand DNA-binding protein